MKFLNFIGIDMSRNWFDAHLLKSESSSRGVHEQFSNDKKGFRAFKKWLSKNIRQSQETKQRELLPNNRCPTLLFYV